MPNGTYQPQNLLTDHMSYVSLHAIFCAR